MPRNASEIVIVPGRDWDHDKPDETGPCILIHQLEDGAFSEDNPAHCFGPFLNLTSAMAFVTAMNEIGSDDCIKTIIPMIPPPGTVVADVDTKIGTFVGDDGGLDREIVGMTIDVLRRTGIKRDREQVRRDAQN